MRIGIFGGSFDPVHFGHLLLAEVCREQGSLDQVWFVPAVVSPHKQLDFPADGTHRAEMLRLAIDDHPPFFVSTIEIARGGVSYTVDTIEQIATERPDDELFLMMGADSLVEFPKWRSPERICELAKILVVGRPHAQPPDLAALNVFGVKVAESAVHVSMPLLEYSSTEIRRRIRDGSSIRFRTPRNVGEYIFSHGLYK